jgi:hypothetical protein
VPRWYTVPMTDTPLDARRRDHWHTDGWCVLDEFMTGDDLDAARSDLSSVFPPVEQVLAGSDTFDISWDTSAKPKFPFESTALNRLTVHDRLIDLAEDLLGTPAVRLYQGMVTAKYPGGSSDYEQLLHVDYGNHTLVVPRTDPGYQHLELFVYLSDVNEDTAPTRIVSRRLTGDIPVERTYLSVDEYAPLYRAEVSATGPAGSVLAYRPDVFHRGTSLTSADEARYLLHVAFKPVDTDWLGFHTWPVEAEGLAWHRFVPQASVRQLTVLGFPEPGHPYWNAGTLDGVAARYPGLDMTPWRRSAATPAGD